MNAGNKSQDFESNWQDKLSRVVEKKADSRVRDYVLAGGEGLSDQSTSRERLVWTCQALERLGESVPEATRLEILSACHCWYPLEDLQDIKQAYREDGDVDAALVALQVKFESFLRDTLDLEEELIEDIVARGWGLAGRRQGQTIIATKIPKSGSLMEYFETDDPAQKRRLYCHCPRVRDEVGNDPILPPEYCYCGAGFYQGIWEEILGRPVEVEMLESVMQGGEVCRIAIHLPRI